MQRLHESAGVEEKGHNKKEEKEAQTTQAEIVKDHRFNLASNSSTPRFEAPPSLSVLTHLSLALRFRCLQASDFLVGAWTKDSNHPRLRSFANGFPNTLKFGVSLRIKRNEMKVRLLARCKQNIYGK
jgi:hypothetical protein